MVRLESDHGPAESWRRLWDLDRHTAVIPLTRVTLLPPATALGEGATFCARTALGPLGFDDPMRVVSWRAPDAAREPAGVRDGHAVIDKTGSLIGGRIKVRVVPTAAGGAWVTWRQHVELRWLPSPLSWVERPVAGVVALGYRAVLRRLLA